MESTEEETPLPPETSEEHSVTPSSTIVATTAKISSSENEIVEPTDEAVLSYLRKRGLANAALELTKIIRSSNTEPETNRERIEMEEAESRAQRTLLARSTGGGFGYDQDGSAQVPQWGVPDTKLVAEDDDTDAGNETVLKNRMGLDEAKAYVDSFTTLQTWVLTLPDDPAMPMKKRSKLAGQETTGISIASLTRSAAGDEPIPANVLKAAEELDEPDMDLERHMPPSAKPELLAVTFSLFIHTYCEIVEVGMESTAQALLASFRTIYEPLYGEELKDLDACRTTEDMVRLNSYNTQHIDSLARLKAIMVQVANLQLKKEELGNDTSSNNPQAKASKLAEYDQYILQLQVKYQEMAKQATNAFKKMKDFPFLRRARAVRWQLTLSATSYGLLSQFLSSRESLLPMSTLLLTKCEIQVERRDPLPYTPACLLDDFVVSSRTRQKTRNDEEIQWAAPIAAKHRIAEAGEDGAASEKLPFPRLYLDDSYGTVKDAARAKMNVEFSRSLLVNGFRRLEALERKSEHDSGLKTIDETSTATIVSPLEPSVLLSTLCSSSSSGSYVARFGPADISSIWQESGVGITCAKLCRPDGRRVAAGCDDSAVRIWSIFDPRKDEGDDNEVKETSIVLLGHKNGFPVFDVSWNRDGRTLLSAGGDGSVRLWDTMAVGPFGSVVKPKSRLPSKPTDGNENEKPEEPGMSIPGLKAETSDVISGAALAVYRGHSPSVPIWSVSMALSGYYFATAAADATARIWVTDKPTPVRILSGHATASVNTVVWHPNCNYVLTGGDDSTVRMWDVQTGRCVRLLNAGSLGINVVSVCPSGRFCSGADYSGTIHVWDLGSGKKVNEYRAPANAKRNYTGSATASMIHSLCYSPCGSALAAGGDDCVVRIWDVRGTANHMGNADFAGKQGWGEAAPLQDVASVQHTNRLGTKVPHHTFVTRRTMLLDLQYTKQNLLLAVGKYTTPVPLVSPIAD